MLFAIMRKFYIRPALSFHAAVLEPARSDEPALPQEQSLANLVPALGDSSFLWIPAGSAEQIADSQSPENVQEIASPLAAAIAEYEQKLQVARTGCDQQGVWQSLLSLGIAWSARESARAGGYLREALEVAQTIDDAPMLAYSLDQLGNWLTNVEQPLQAIPVHMKASGLFEQSNDQHGLATSLDALGTAYASLGKIEQAVSHYRRAARLFRLANDRRSLSSCLAMLTLCGAQYLTSVSNAAGQDLPQCIQDGEESLAIAREIGWRSGEALALINLGLALSLPGQYGRALKDIQSGLQIAREIEHRHCQILAHLALGAIHLDLLAARKAQGHLEQALALASQTEANAWHALIVGFLVPAYLLQDHLHRAEALCAPFSTDTPMETIGQRQAWFALAALSLAQGNVERALDIAERLIRTISGTSEYARYSLPRLEQLRCEALAKLGKTEEAQTILEFGLKKARGRGAPSFIWRFHIWLGQIYWRRRRYGRASHHFVTARQLIEKIANTVPDRKLRESFLRQTSKLIPVPSARRDAKRLFGGLTKREFEVAALIAKRKSNWEIAEELALGERRIERYFESILRKLGFNSRTQITAWVIRRETEQTSQTEG